MCTGSETNNLCSSGMKMEVLQEDKTVISRGNCSKLLELAATDDLSGFMYEVEEKGCDINEASFWYGRSLGSKKMCFEQRTPLLIASLYGSTKILNYIVRTGRVDVNTSCGLDRATPLHCAAAGGSWPSLEIIKLLINASGDIHAVAANGMMPSDVIAPCVKSSISSRRRALEMVLSGRDDDDDDNDREIEGRIQLVKKEYPVDVSLPDINNGVYGTDEFRMYNFKVNPCSRAYPHDWTECPFVHPGENARRRDPRKCNYTCVPCPEFKKGSCAKGDACEYAHGVFESWLHPAQYRTRLCKDETGCSRRVCFFAHKPEELRPLYASTGSAMPSPKPISTNAMGSTTLSPLSLGSSSLMRLNASSMSPSVTSLSSPYKRVGDLKPNNLDDMFGSPDHSILLSRLQGVSPKVNNNNHHLRASYPSNISSRKPYGLDSSAAVAAAVMNSRSAAFANRSQSFVDRNRSGLLGSPSPMPLKQSGWGSPDGKVDWGFNGHEEANRLRKSASFGIRSGAVDAARSDVGGPDVSWVNSLVKEGGGVYDMTMMPHWVDQMYMEQEQMVA